MIRFNAAVVKPISEADITRVVDWAKRQTGEDMARLFDQIGQDMVTECVSIVNTELVNQGRHKPNTTRLAESFTYKVERGNEPGGWPWTVSLTVKPGVSFGKVGALNYGYKGGTASYTIRPRNTGKLRWPNRPGYGRPGKAFAYATQAVHPGAGPKQGTHFLERAAQTVFARYGLS